MRNKLFLFMISAVTLVLVVGAVAGAARAARAVRPCSDTIGYNMLAERTFQGKVAGGRRVIEGLVYFPLKTAGTIMDVQIGTEEFVDQSHFRLGAGEAVTVIGMPVVIGDRKVLLARQVRSAKGVLIVRDEMGLPLWESPNPMQMDPERRARPFEICDNSFSN